MDYDDDGTLDLISGSYDPGDLYLMRGLGGGEYAAITGILDETGTPLVHHPEELKTYEDLRHGPSARDRETMLACVASFGSWPAPVDWDDDGDLDLLIGTFRGKLFRRMNVGTRAEPAYAAESLPVEADGVALQVSGHADPVAADWDGDGLWDLVVGSSNGSVGWYRNVGSLDAPVFGAVRELVEAKSDSKFLTRYLEPGEAPEPGVRAQIDVVDYDGDGRLDLLLGDYVGVVRLRAMEPGERVLFDALVEERAAVRSRLQDDPDPAVREALEREAASIDADQLGYLASVEADEAGKPTIRSSVWLFLRRPESAEDDGHLPTPSLAVPTAGGPAGLSGWRLGGAAAGGPVAIDAAVASKPGEPSDRLTLTVRVDIADGWFLYASVPEGGPGIATTLRLDLPASVRAMGAWRRPEGKASPKDPRARIYTGTVVFACDLEVGEGGGEFTLGIDVDYQVCNEELCLPPATLGRSVTVKPQE